MDSLVLLKEGSEVMDGTVSSSEQLLMGENPIYQRKKMDVMVVSFCHLLVAIPSYIYYRPGRGAQMGGALQLARSLTWYFSGLG